MLLKLFALTIVNILNYYWNDIRKLMTYSYLLLFWITEFKIRWLNDLEINHGIKISGFITNREMTWIMTDLGMHLMNKKKERKKKESKR